MSRGSLQLCLRWEQCGRARRGKGTGEFWTNPGALLVGWRGRPDWREDPGRTCTSLILPRRNSALTLLTCLACDLHSRFQHPELLFQMPFLRFDIHVRDRAATREDGERSVI